MGPCGKHPCFITVITMGHHRGSPALCLCFLTTMAGWIFRRGTSLVPGEGRPEAASGLPLTEATRSPPCILREYRALSVSALPIRETYRNIRVNFFKCKLESNHHEAVQLLLQRPCAEGFRQQADPGMEIDEIQGGPVNQARGDEHRHVGQHGPQPQQGSGPAQRSEEHTSE